MKRPRATSPARWQSIYVLNVEPQSVRGLVAVFNFIFHSLTDCNRQQ
jgi:hypothetical protein